MKLPRNISGKELAAKLSFYSYEITRQNGSHIRLTTQQSGEHHITNPRHDPFKNRHAFSHNKRYCQAL